VLRRVFGTGETEAEIYITGILFWQETVLGGLDKVWEVKWWECGNCETFFEKFRWWICRPHNITICRPHNITICRPHNLTICRPHNITICRPHNITICRPHNITICRPHNIWICSYI
jgi:hypothetical protein